MFCTFVLILPEVYAVPNVADFSRSLISCFRGMLLWYVLNDFCDGSGCHYYRYNLCSQIYRTIILPVVLDGCETWSLTLREEHRLRVFENRVLRRIFGPKRDGVTGEWRKLHNEELNRLYSSPNIVRVIKSRIMR